VSATANAVVGGAQGLSLLVAGAVAAVLSPRGIYAIAGLLGVAAAIAIAVFNAARATGTGQPVFAGSKTAQQRGATGLIAAVTTTRLAIDHMRSAGARRESCVGTWLPEPIVADLHESPEQMAELSDSLSMAFRVLLESLSPVERAVFLLREIFGYSYEDIAQVVDKNEANCRQIFVRARQHLDAYQPRCEASTEQSESTPVRASYASTWWRPGGRPRSSPRPSGLPSTSPNREPASPTRPEALATRLGRMPPSTTTSHSSRPWYAQ
jgi:RNA polymerase sigma factor (sigma-70 family)